MSAARGGVVEIGVGRFEPMACAVDALRVEIEAGEPPEPDAAMRSAWSALCARNPRLFNGRILSFVGVGDEVGDEVGDGEGSGVGGVGVLRARVDRYMRLLLGAPGVRHLAVTGVLRAHDSRGRGCVLLGRRSERVGVHAGMWELAPGGGLECPADGGSALSGRDVLRQLEREIEEELGLGLGLGVGGRGASVLGIAFDAGVPSADIVIAVELGGRVEEHAPELGGARWEYAEAAWVPVDELGEFDALWGERIIAPSRCVLRTLGDGAGAS